MDLVSTLLEILGYEFRANFSTPDRYYFINDLPDPDEGKRRYHIHLTYPNSFVWNELIGFRDYLLTHPDEVQKYPEVKKQAAIKANGDSEIYRNLKDPTFKRFNSIINNKN